MDSLQAECKEKDKVIMSILKKWNAWSYFIVYFVSSIYFSNIIFSFEFNFFKANIY